MHLLDAEKEITEPLLRSQSLPELSFIRMQLKHLYKLSGKSKEERYNNRILFMFLGTFLVLVQLANAIIKLLDKR